MLRAVIGGDGQQQILAAVPRYAMQVLDVREVSAEQAREELTALRERLAQRVYDPSRWPLFEVCVTRLADERARVHVSIDLLIADVWSLFILFREWGLLYAEPQRQLAPLALSFRDYVLAEVALQGTPRYARARQYWTQRLQKLRPGPELPLAKQPAAVAQPRFERRRARVAAPQWSQVKARARATGLTPSLVLCTAFVEVLAAWSKSPQFTLNVTLFHRLPLHPEVNAVVGDFTSTVLLAVDGGGTGSFIERAQRLQQQLWEDLEHRYVSGVQVLRDLARLAGSGPRMGMPVVFTSTLGQEDTDAVAEWLGELVYGVSQTPQVWLDHQVAEERGALVFNWDAVEALFPQGLLDAMFAAYCARIEQLAADETSWNTPTPTLLPNPQRQLLDSINDTAVAVPDVTLAALVLAQVEQRPEQRAVLSPERELSYAELGAASTAVASWLLERGTERNSLVAVVMEKGWEQIVAVLGVVQAGAAYLPIEADVPAERLALLLEQGEATLVLTQSWLQDTLSWPPGRTLLAVDRVERTETNAKELRAAAPRGEDLAYVIFTSGSTGVPKGVMLTHKAVVNTLLDINRRWAIGPEDRVLALSALSFDLSVYDIFGTLAAGGTVVLPAAAARRDPAHWLARLAETRVTIWNSVPALMQLLVETAEARATQLPDALRLVLLSGDWIPVRLPDRIRACAPGAQVIGLGGATEAAIWSIAYPIGDVDPSWPSIPYGRPLANQTWRVLHENGTPCPVWVPGELYIGGAGLAHGYWRDAERTAARFVAHPQTGERLYRTGDWGRCRSDGTLEFLGREDLQVKVHGYRIELGEIEAALARQPGVERAVVVAHGERMGEKRLAAYVVAGGTAATDAETLRRALKATLPAYMLPATIELLTALPLTANGKVDRTALPLAASKPPSATVPRDERASVADRIERLVADALKVERVDRNADLFALGLTSIDMMRLANELERTFGFRPKIGDLFKLTDVAAVASYYERLLDARRSEPGAGTLGPLLGDLGQRDAFKKEQRRLRPLTGPLPPVRLPRGSVAAGAASGHERRSRRAFSTEPVALADFSAWLACLAQSREENRPKHRYGSAGGLYPVQAYLHVRPGRIDDLEAGTYYYHPAEHVLLPLTPDVDIDRTVHAVVNRPVYDRAAFSLFLVAQMSAIEPVYGDKGRDFALIEAGLATQLLEETAARHRIGLCQIGLLDFDAIRDRFLLERSHLFLHAMLGGRVAPDARAWEEGVL
jgi:amino acid adenylation domain-containing protein